MQQLFRERLECSQPGDTSKKTLCVTLFCIYIATDKPLHILIAWIPNWNWLSMHRLSNAHTKPNEIQLDAIVYHANFTYSINVRCVCTAFFFFLCICNIVAGDLLKAISCVAMFIHSATVAFAWKKGNVFMKPFILPWIFFLLLFVPVQKYLATLSQTNTLCT